MRYDVVVVGGGPAGSMAAKTAAENGLNTLLIEEHAAFGTPVHCGEGLPGDGLKKLDLQLDPRCIAAKVRGANIFAPSGEKIPFLVEDMLGYVLDRKVFDKFLAIEAARAGVDILVRTMAVGVAVEEGFVNGVSAIREGKKLDISSKIVIAADGIKSNVARWANLNTLARLNDVNSCYQYEMVGVHLDEPDMLQLHFGREVAPGGYAWIFPKGPDAANVGLGVRGGSERSAKDCLDSFVKRESCLQNAKVVEIRAGVIPLGGPIKKMVANGLMVTGTAAHMVNPITGGGMTLAMLSGVMAGKVAVKALKEGKRDAERLGEYEQEFKGVYENRLRNMLRIRHAFDRMADGDLNDFLKLFPEIYELFHPFKDVSLSEKVAFILKRAPRLTKFLKALLIG